MDIQRLGSPQTIVSNQYGIHNYFAWPSIARLRNGKIAAGCSGFRLAHICPFGKAALVFSEDEGKSYTAPVPVIDTVLDDRDTGLCPFGQSGLIVTSFTNTLQFQRDMANGDPYRLAYLDKVSPEQEQAALGATFRISFDNGVTFGPLYKSPITSPHGPLELSDGTILWVGRTFSGDNTFRPQTNSIYAYTVSTDGTMKRIGTIENVCDGHGELFSCEPHAVELPGGKLICHIRVQRYGADNVFTLYQSESLDNGFSWSKPHPLLDSLEGAPAHLLLHSSGTLICVYGHRELPFGIRVMFSFDNAETWSRGYDLYSPAATGDLGYPATAELADGSLITVFYTHPAENEPAIIMQQKWSFVK